MRVHNPFRIGGSHTHRFLTKRNPHERRRVVRVCVPFAIRDDDDTAGHTSARGLVAHLRSAGTCVEWKDRQAADCGPQTLGISRSSRRCSALATDRMGPMGFVAACCLSCVIGGLDDSRVPGGHVNSSGRARRITSPSFSAGTRTPAVSVGRSMSGFPIELVGVHSPFRIGGSHTCLFKTRGTPVKLDRELQLHILERLSKCYPLHDREYLQELPDADVDHVARTLLYLEEHGLVVTTLRTGNNPGNWMQGAGPRITAKGMDFLADDGGLSAVLGVVTVKIHEESLRALLLAKAETLPDATPEQRSAVAEAIRNLPARSIQTVADKLIALGVEHLPAGAHQLHIWISQALSSLHVAGS
ncbi:hypothetical protein BCAR13_110094 [Paraburkholderia caribensis]|nr:hypothetical protein BCAR13_110094 [Paraburkholderia caribensis]